MKRQHRCYLFLSSNRLFRPFFLWSIFFHCNNNISSQCRILYIESASTKCAPNAFPLGIGINPMENKQVNGYKMEQSFSFPNNRKSKRKKYRVRNVRHRKQHKSPNTFFPNKTKTEALYTMYNWHQKQHQG